MRTFWEDVGLLGVTKIVPLDAAGAIDATKMAVLARMVAALMRANDRVERPATMTVPRTDAAHYASQSAPTNIRRLPALEAVEPHGI